MRRQAKWHKATPRTPSLGCSTLRFQSVQSSLLPLTIVSGELGARPGAGNSVVNTSLCSPGTQRIRTVVWGLREQRWGISPSIGSGEASPRAEKILLKDHSKVTRKRKGGRSMSERAQPGLGWGEHCSVCPEHRVEWEEARWARGRRCQQGL